MATKTFKSPTADVRLDKFLSQKLTDYSRTDIQTWNNDGLIMVNGIKVKDNYRLTENDIIEVAIPEEEPFVMEAENMPLDILYEDDDLAVIIKPKGVVVHPGDGNEKHTLANALLYHFDKLSNLNGEKRPGIVHRHDKDTSGTLVIAKTNEAHEHLAEQFKEHTPTRHYLALVHGDIPHESGEIEVPIGRDPKNRKQFAATNDGKEALTRFTVKEHFKDYALVEASLYTGRTHQIRVHLKYINHPIIGDPTYGMRRPIDKATEMCLFANKLGFIHPTTGEEMMFEAPLPDFFAKTLKEI